ncbi:MAG: glycosyl transferase family 2 [Peptococcaceae bacterium]|nr:glycosyl transferase family 2 [Peptococcaceae bacterium]
MKIKLLGPLDDVTGYGEVARQLALVMQDLGVDVSVQPQNWGCTHIELPPELDKRIKIMKHLKQTPESFFYVNVPPFFKRQGKPVIGLTMSEVDGIPEKWVKACNSVDFVLVPSRFNLETFQQSGVQPEKLKVVPLGINSTYFTPEGPKFTFPPAHSLFTFLSIGEWTPRKGFDILIRAFVQEFSRDDDVCLVLKCHCNGSDYDPSGNKIQKEIKGIVAREKKSAPPRIFHIPQTLPSQDMPALYRMAQCFVLATRGEGWNVPVFEALACGVPVLVTNWSAYLDFLNEENAYLINVDALEPVPFCGIPTDEIYQGHRWARPNIEHLRYLMRYVYENYAEARNKAAAGQSTVSKHLRWDLCGKRIIQHFSHLVHVV